MPAFLNKPHLPQRLFRGWRRRTPVIAALGFTMLSAGCISMADVGLNALEVKTSLLTDTSDSMLGTGQFEELSLAICDGMKAEARAGDSVTLIPYAAKSISTHSMKLENRLDILGLCKPENFLQHLTTSSDVVSNHGTSLNDVMQRLQQTATPGMAQDSPAHNSHGSVIILLAHADDQGVGAEKAVPLAETAQRAKDLLDANTVLVIFAIDGQLQRDLERLLQHPQVRISALSEASIADSMHWAYQVARRQQQPASQQATQ